MQQRTHLPLPVRCGYFRPTGLTTECLVWQVAQRSKKQNPTSAQSDQNAASLVFVEVSSRIRKTEVFIRPRCTQLLRAKWRVEEWQLKGCLHHSRCAFCFVFAGSEQDVSFFSWGCRCSWTVRKSRLTTWKLNKAQTTGLHVLYRRPGLSQ